mmetsp:Transcript_26586/g.38524  ORF Transcript_26586/g.38524 Transcript_26586/m.38524 type:complete len:104 (-) Transcript_26586:255-566(-)
MGRVREDDEAQETCKEEVIHPVIPKIEYGQRSEVRTTRVSGGCRKSGRERRGLVREGWEHRRHHGRAIVLVPLSHAVQGPWRQTGSVTALVDGSVRVLDGRKE